MFRDFGLVARSHQDLATRDAARSRRDLSLETYLGELKKRAVLGEDVDIDEELQRLDAEGPALPAFPFPPPSAEGDDDDEPAMVTDAAEMTVNELTLGIERLGRLGDVPFLNEMRRQLASKLSISYPGDADPETLGDAKIELAGTSEADPQTQTA